MGIVTERLLEAELETGMCSERLLGIEGGNLVPGEDPGFVLCS